MGSIFGKKFVRDDKIEGQGKHFLLFAKKIGMQKYEVDRIYEEFFNLEDKSTHLVDTMRILEQAKRPYSLIISVILQIFDRNKTGQLNLMEYVMVLWCFLSTDEDGLARMCFGLFDMHKTNSLDIGEIRYLVHAVWEFNPSKSCLNVLKKLEQNTDGVVAVVEFILLNKHHKELLKPLRKLRNRIRKMTVFTRYWKQLMWRRLEEFGTQSMFQICDRMEDAYIESSMEYLNLRTDIVPRHFIEQWQHIQRRKASRGTLHQELPYEIRETLKPHPLNKHTKRTLKSVAKGMTVLARFRRKSKLKPNSVLHDSASLDTESAAVAEEDEERQREEVKEEDRFDERERESRNFPPKVKPFDDSFLGSLKAPPQFSK